MVTATKTAAFTSFTGPAATNPPTPLPAGKFWHSEDTTVSPSLSEAQTFLLEGFQAHLNNTHSGNTGSFAQFDYNEPLVIPYPDFPELYPFFSGKQYVVELNWKDSGGDEWTDTELNDLGVILGAAPNKYLYYTFEGSDPYTPPNEVGTHTFYGELDQVSFGYNQVGNVFSGFSFDNPLLTITGLAAVLLNDGTAPETASPSGLRVIARTETSPFNDPHRIAWGLISGDATGINRLVELLNGVPVNAASGLGVQISGNLSLFGLTIEDGELRLGGRKGKSLRRLTTLVG
ncbi:hypothetical protein [Pseudomonas aeruginosa]|uniref:hypothetical protein n=1 Tax=Pseudomonas aeruginosa TaxID=287 RepID=UPI000F7F15ED|nr:hypothetical protein [Pseudomonas aeruginosa]RTB44112.1 hypothetical protein EJ655_08215 [Pseudomonas aeruginosa]